MARIQSIQALLCILLTLFLGLPFSKAQIAEPDSLSSDSIITFDPVEALDTNVASNETILPEQDEVEPAKAPDKYSIRFSEKDLIAEKGQLVGTNVFIKNNSAEAGSFSLDFALPNGWKIFGGQAIYAFEAGEEKLLPVRLMPTNLIGNTKFVINVLVFDELGNQVTGDFFYVGSKKVVEWDMAVGPSNTIYLKNGESESGFDLNILNLGNFKQDLVLSVKGIRSGLLLKNEDGKIIDNPRYSLSLDPLSDTTFKYLVETTQEIRNFRAISLQEHKPEVNDEEKSYTLFVNSAEAKKSSDYLKQKGQRISFKRLANDKKVKQYSGPIIPLIVDANFQNVLNRNTFLNLMMRGFQTFKDGSNLVYFNQLTFGQNEFSQRFLQNGTYYGGYFNKDFTVEIGNVSGGNIGLPSAGLGAKATARVYKDHWVGSYWLRRNQLFQSNDVTNFGGLYQYRGTGTLRGSAGWGRAIDNTRNRQATVFNGRLGVRLAQSHSLSILGAYSDRRSINNSTDTLARSGLLLGAGYSGRFLDKKLVTNISARYQQPTFGLADNERTIVNTRLQYFLRSKSSLYFNSTFNENRYPNRSTTTGPAGDFLNMIFFNTAGYNRVTRYGTVQNYAYYNINSIIGKRVISPGVGVRYSNYLFDKNILYAVNVQGGYDKALFIPELPWYFRMNFNALLRVRTFSLVSGYFYGPNSPAAVESMVATGVNPIFLRTSLNHQYLFKNTHFALVSNINHTFQNNLNSHRIGTFPELFYFTNDGWRFSLGMNYSLSTRKIEGGLPLFGDQVDELAGERLTNTSSQVNVSVRKEFGIRIPFVDKSNFTQDFIAFYDLDGDGKKSKSEPPLENILIRLGDCEVLTNQDGKSLMEYVPSGYHQLVAFSLEKLEGWFPNIEDSLLIFKDQVQNIPFVKGVKVYGKVVVDREQIRTDIDKKLDLGRIKIAAICDQTEISTLTDFDGDFEFYLPNGMYTLSMDEGILGDRYSLVRNNFPMELENGTEGLFFTFNIVERKREVVTKQFGAKKVSRPNGSIPEKAAPPKIPRITPPPSTDPNPDEVDPNGMPFKIERPDGPIDQSIDGGTDQGDVQPQNFPPRTISDPDNAPNIQPLIDAPIVDPTKLRYIIDLGTFTESVPTGMLNLIIDLGYSNEVDAGQNQLQFLSSKFENQTEAQAVSQRALALGLTDPRPQIIGEYDGRRLSSEQVQELSLKIAQQDPEARPSSPIQW